MYHFSWGSLLSLLTCKASCETRVKTRKCFMWRTCDAYLILRPWVGRGLRPDDESQLCYLLTCKALGETRDTTRKCFLWRTCNVYLIARPSVARGLRLDDISCNSRKLALCTYLWSLGWDESYDSKKLHLKNLCCLRNCKAFGGSRVKARWCISFPGEACSIYLLVRPRVRRELRLENDSCEERVLFAQL